MHKAYQSEHLLRKPILAVSITSFPLHSSLLAKSPLSNAMTSFDSKCRNLPSSVGIWRQSNCDGLQGCHPMTSQANTMFKRLPEWVSSYFAIGQILHLKASCTSYIYANSIDIIYPIRIDISTLIWYSSNLCFATSIAIKRVRSSNALNFDLEGGEGCYKTLSLVCWYVDSWREKQSDIFCIVNACSSCFQLFHGFMVISIFTRQSHIS